MPRVLRLVPFFLFLLPIAVRADHCDELRHRYHETKAKIAQLEYEIARGKQAKAMEEVRDAIKDAKEAMDAGASASDVADGIRVARELLARQGGSLKEFLDGVADGLDKSSELFEEVSNALDQINRITKMLEADPHDPVESLDAFQNCFEMLNDLLGGLIERIPGLGDFMEFYNESLKAITGALREIRDKRVRQGRLVEEYLGFNPYDPEQVRKSGLEAELGRIAAEINSHCQDKYVVREGRLWTAEAWADETARREAEAEAARREAERRLRCAQIKSEADRIGSEADRLRERAQNLRDRVTGATSSQQTDSVKREADRLEEEARRLEERLRELDHEAWSLPCDDEVRTAISTAQDSASNASGRASSMGFAARRIEAARQALGDCADCWERLCRAIEEANDKKQELDEAEEEAEDIRNKIEELDGEAKKLNDEMEKTEDDVTHYYEAPNGKLVAAAVFQGEYIGSLRYVGWVMNREAASTRSRNRRRLEEMKEERDRLEEKHREKKREIERKKRELDDALAEVERIRRACEECEDEVKYDLPEWLHEADIFREHGERVDRMKEDLPDLPPRSSEDPVADPPEAGDDLYDPPREVVPKGTEEWNAKHFGSDETVEVSGRSDTEAARAQAAATALARRNDGAWLTENWLTTAYEAPRYHPALAEGVRAGGPVEGTLEGPAAPAVMVIEVASPGEYVVEAASRGGDAVTIVYGPNPRRGARAAAIVEDGGTFRAARSGRYVFVTSIPDLDFDERAGIRLDVRPLGAQAAASRPSDEDRTRKALNILLDVLDASTRDDGASSGESTEGSGSGVSAGQSERYPVCEYCGTRHAPGAECPR